MLAVKGLSHNAATPWLLVTFLSLLSFTMHAQQADFSFVQSSNCVLQVVTFTDQSSGNFTSWKWDFGNGNQVSNNTNQNVQAIYTTAGTYTVSLTVSNGTTSRTASKELVVHARPHADFSFDLPVAKCAPRTIQFTNESTDKPQRTLSYRWVFGDGGSSEEADPAYTYRAPGTYSVTLTATNDMGCDTSVVKTQIIEVEGFEAAFNINAEGSLCSAPASIKFTSTGDDAPTLEWDFGDGTTGTGKEIDHSYTTTGTFTATLKLSDGTGCVSEATKQIIIGREGGVAFSTSIEKACIGTSVSFTPTIDGTIESLEWDFGDGSSSSEFDPTKQYTVADTYTVTLTVKLFGKQCESIVSKEIEVIPDAVPDFTFSVNCAGQVTFTNTSTESTSWEWNFGDQTNLSVTKSPKHSYAFTGLFLVTLKAFNEAGCYMEVQKNVLVAAPPLASFSPAADQDCLNPSLSGCAPFNLSLENTSMTSIPLKEILWEFGDGETSTENHPQHTYDTGSFTLKLTVTNELGCKNSISKKVNVASSAPVPDFTMDTTVVCVGQGVQFSNLSTGANFYCWDFGDTSGATDTHPVHSYGVPGTYFVTLKAKNDGCESSFLHPTAIVVKAPMVAFTAEKTSCSTPYDVNFVNISQDYDKFVWDFGDGTRDSTNLFRTYRYSSTGQFEAKLTASNATTGCEVTSVGYITIQEIKADFTIDKINVCLKDTVFATDKSEFAVAWKWDMGNAKISKVQEVSTTYMEPGLYNFTLRAYDSDSCMSQKVIPVQVLNMIGNFNHSAFSLCDSVEVSFHDLTDADPPVAKWLWNFGDGNTSEEQNPKHYYNEEGSYSVTLRLYNEDDLFCEIIRPDAILFQRPVADFTTGSDHDLCIGEPITFLNSSLRGSTFVWDLGDGKTDTNQSYCTTSYNAPGTYSVTLTLTDANGCVQTIARNNFITVTKPEVHFRAEDTFRECPPLITTFIDSTSTAVTWNWSFGDGNKSTFENPVNTYVRPGVYDVTLIAADKNGCADTLTVEKVATIGGPDGIINVNPATICLGDTVYYEAIANNALYYRWDFGDGVVTDMTETTTSHLYDEVGQSTVKAVFIDASGCEVAAPIEPVVTKLPTPDVSFTYHHPNPFEDEVLTLKGVSSNGTDFQWFANDSAFSTQSTTTIIFEKPGVKNVTFRAFNELGCYSDTTQQIQVQGIVDFIPNVFTPNEDDIHQTFEIPNVEYGSWNLYIYNRWGKLVHQEGHYNSKWEAKGLSSGVYYYVLQNATRDVSFKGYVHVIY